VSKPTYKHERFCKRCNKWVKPWPSPATLYGITTYDEICPGCDFAVNFSEKRAALEASKEGGVA
jgi:vacuolar-type H+-ATPase subunit I/STV1